MATRPSVAIKMVKHAIIAKRPIMIWGQPGVGKSSIIRQLAASLGIDMVDMRLSLLDPTALMGFPYRDGHKMHFAPSAMLPTDPDSKGILMLDEINSAPPAVQAAAYQLILDRKIGEYSLPDGWAIVAAGNRETDRGVTFSMPAPLANRFIHIEEFDVNFEDWRTWAMETNLRVEVINFINFKPDMLNKFDSTSKVFPTPRTWEFVSDILNSNADASTERALVTGAIGAGAATEFMAFLKIYRNLPDPDMVILNPEKADVPTDLATLYALCGALSVRASEANIAQILIYAARMKPEFQMLLIRDAVRRNTKLLAVKAISDWAVTNSAMFF